MTEPIPPAPTAANDALDAAGPPRHADAPSARSRFGEFSARSRMQAPLIATEGALAVRLLAFGTLGAVWLAWEFSALSDGWPELTLLDLSQLIVVVIGIDWLPDLVERTRWAQRRTIGTRAAIVWSALFAVILFAGIAAAYSIGAAAPLIVASAASAIAAAVFFARATAQGNSSSDQRSEEAR